jgi:ATPase family associated with various cellular activities (AAA)
VTAVPTWEDANNNYLAASLTWLRARLAALAGTEQPGDAVEKATAERAIAAQIPDAEPALIFVAGQLGLTDFERDVLLLCVAPAVDPSIGPAIAAAQGSPAAAVPTFALALQLFDDPRWEILSAGRGLRYWHLVEPVQARVQPLTSAPRGADERIVNLVKGLNQLDERLTGLVESPPDPAPGIPLPSSGQAAADALVTAVFTAVPDGRFPVLELAGADAEGAELIAARTVARLDRVLHRASAAAIAARDADAELLARLWQRESLLLPVALLIDTHEADLGDPAIAGPVRRFVTALEGLTVVSVRELWPIPDRQVAVVDIEHATAAEQRELWAGLTGLPPGDAPATLAAQFRLGVPTLQRVAVAAGERPTQDTLWAGCLAATRPRLETLAARTVPRARWDELVLPAEQVDLLHQIVGHLRHRNRVMSEWGFGARLARGGGITALFTGPSGTGKTFAAEVLAGELGLDLYRVDLSAVVSKYIGETEKNLRRVFDAAECGGALLLFDEADALFGRRSEVRDSHDRYANIEVNYLLQRMESYQGLAVLATNLRAALDPAFLRRLRFVVEFDVPGPAQRRELWSRAFPAAVPLLNVDVDALAQLPTNGAAIQQIALSAAFLAAGAGDPVDTRTVLRAARTEFRKLGLPLPAVPS